MQESWSACRANLPPNEGEPRAELGEGVLEAFGEGGLDHALVGSLSEVEEIEDVGGP
jgi:hypothetical protein